MKKKKLGKVLFGLILFMIIAIYILRKYVLADVPISQKFGAYQPSSISLNDSIHIKTYSTTKYFDLIERKEYDLAYQMLTDEYKRYMSYDKYLNEINKYNFKDWVVKSVKQISDVTFVITLEDMVTKENHIYIVYANKFNNKVFTISPEKFIYYDAPNTVENSRGLECTLVEYSVFQDSVNLRLKINNKTSKEVTINDVKVELALAGRLANKFEPVTLAPHEEKEYEISYTDTSYYIPKDVLIETEFTTIKIDLQ